MIQYRRLVFAGACIALLFAVSPAWATTGNQEGVDVPAEVRVTSPNSAQTSSVAISPVDTQKLVTATQGPGDGPRMHYSHDGGSTWTQVDLPVGSEQWGATVEWSSDGQFAYTAAVDGCGEGCRIFFYRSDDDGVTWTGLETETPGDPRRLIAYGTSGDGYLHVDQYATSPHKDNIYMMYSHWLGVMHLARSKNFGDKWLDKSFSSAPLGSRGDVTTDRAGNVYYAWPGTDTLGVYVSKSTNGGASFGEVVNVGSRNAYGAFRIPALPYDGVPNQLFADTDTSNGPYADSVYLVWTDSTGPESVVPAENHGRIQVAYSRDGGTTWTSLGMEGFHVVAFAPSRNVGWAAGSDGRIAKIHGETLQ